MNAKGANLIAAVALAATVGCGGGSSSSSSASSTPEADISGTAVKGVIKNGVVKIFGVTDGARQAEPLVAGRTGQDGSYSLEVSGYTGPVVVEISALAAGDDGFPSLMVCDIPEGCGSVAFGADYSLSAGFSLDAVVPAVGDGDELSVNVTALTDLAAAYAEENGITESVADDANAQVANLFSLAGSLLSLAAIDITDADAMEAASEKEQRAALLSAAIMSAGVDAGASIEDALDNISTDFANNSGQLLNSESTDSSLVTLLEIMEEAQAILAEEVFDDVDLGAVSTLVDNLVVQVGNAPADQRSTAQAPDEDLIGDIEIAAAFVQDIRDVGTAAAFENIETGGAQFEDNLSAAGDIVNDDTEIVLEGLAMAVAAIEEALEEAQDESSYVAENGITVSISGTDYAVDQNVNVETDGGASSSVAVELTASGTIETEESGDDMNGQESVDISLNISGNAASDVVQLVIDTGDVTIDSANEWQTVENVYTETETVSTASFDLDVSIEQVSGSNPASFEGGLAFALTGLSLEEEQQWSGIYVTAWSIDESFNNLSMTLDGTFTQGSNSFEATMTLNADGGDFVDSASIAFENSMIVIEESEETTDAFIDFDFALNFAAELPGVDDSAEVTLTGDRSALESGEVTLTLAYNGKSLEVVANVSNGSSAELTISNHNDAEFSWTDTNIDDDTSPSGVITVAGEQVATVGEENGLVIIRYEDGTFESL